MDVKTFRFKEQRFFTTYPITCKLKHHFQNSNHQKRKNLLEDAVHCPTHWQQSISQNGKASENITNITEYYLYSTSIMLNNVTTPSVLESRTEKCFYGAPTM